MGLFLCEHLTFVVDKYVHAVVETHTIIYLYADDIAFLCLRYRITLGGVLWVVDTQFAYRLDECTCSRTCNKYLVCIIDFAVFNEEFSHTYLGEVLGTLATIDLLLSGFRTIDIAPFTQALTLIVTIPETTIEDGTELAVPLVLVSCGESSVENGIDGFVVSTYNGIEIFRSASPTINL